MPFVLRTETGPINRAVYQVTALDAAPDPAGRHRRHQRPGTAGWSTASAAAAASRSPRASRCWTASLELLGDGYVMATATFNTFQVLCNDVISAETVRRW